MGVLPDAGLWKETSQANRSQERRPERPRSGKRFFQENRGKDGVGLGTQSQSRGKSPRLQRRSSEPSIASVDTSSKIAAGCRQSRMNELKAEGPHNLGRLKQRNDAAYVESVGLTNEADRLHEFRYYLDPAQKRLGTKLGAEEREPQQRPCVQYRYYQDPGQERIVGLKKRGSVEGAKPDSMGEILQGQRDRETGASEPHVRSQRLGRRQGRIPARSESPKSLYSRSTLSSSARAKTPPSRWRDSESLASSFHVAYANSSHKPRARTPPPRWDDSDSVTSFPMEGKARLIYSRNSGSSSVTESSLVSGSFSNKIPNRPLRHSEIAGLLTPTETTISDVSYATSQ